MSRLTYVVANPSIPSSKVTTKVLPSGLGDRRNLDDAGVSIPRLEFIERRSDRHIGLFFLR